MRSKQKLSRVENLFQCPGIVLVVAGYVLKPLVALFLFAGLRGTSFEPDSSLLVPIPFLIFYLMTLYPAMIEGDRRKISSVQCFLVAEAVYIGLRYVYAAIEYPNIGVLEYPRLFFAGYVGTLTVALGQLVVVITWFFLLFAPSVRRWVRDGVKSKEELIELRAYRLRGADSSSKGIITGWGIVRVSACLLFGVAVYLSILLSGSILGRNVPPPDRLSFEELVEQMGTEDHWQLRLRHDVGFYVAKDILKYSSAKMAELPPTSVHGLRVEALDGLARFGPRAIGPLKQSLSDSDLSLRRVAVEALGSIGTEAVEISETLRSMVLELELSARPDGGLYQWVSLHRELLLALLKIAPEDPLTLNTFLEVFEIAKGPRLHSLVVDLANEEGLESGLGQRQLERLLEGGIDPTKFYVLRALRTLDKNRSSLRERFRLWNSLVERVAELLAHPEPAIRRESALLLSGIRPSRIALVEQMMDLVLDEHPAVSRAAVYAFERWGGSSRRVSVANFVSRLEVRDEWGWSLSESDYWKDTASMVRPVEFVGYGMRGDPLVKHSSHITPSEFGFLFTASSPLNAYGRVKQKLSEMRQPNESERITTRRMIIRALGYHGRRAEEAVPLLREFVASDDAPERWEAAISLWKITGNANDALSVFGSFIERLKGIHPPDPRYPILSSTVKAFGEMGDPALPLLSELLTYSDSGLRLRAYIEIEKLLPTNPLARRVVESVVDDSHGIIRLRAQKALSKLDEGL